ncbi:phosphotransferase [Capnocytophaga canimorsus]|uniref:phosphotransferase n=1 Tax=Capnocytophaga canimorsus TaxID=28188 RepID=UPI000F510441|nr:aminoglycoside phosphotransferase family protein [Capnocytophaga canimorsus]AYW36729.1 aminoglycoside phosphotransferase family protein [Capnocytophaga canimorsus]
MKTTAEKIAPLFDMKGEIQSVTPFGNGHINYTFLVKTSQTEYVLQGINTNVFKKPHAIIKNIELLWESEPNNEIILNMIPTKAGGYSVEADNAVWRVVPFAKGYTAYEFVQEPWQAEKAASAYATFIKTFANIDTQKLEDTIPDFHNGMLRYQQLEQAYAQAKPERIEKAKELYAFAQSHKVIFDEVQKAVDSGKIQKRVTHNDTKINNVLINEENPDDFKVIDLDTVMQGILLYDFGDMVRTSVSPTNENEMDDSKIVFNVSFFEAICKGFSVMKEVMTPTEKAMILDGAKYMIFIIGVRFLTDYYNNDIYFKTHFEEENFIRVRNQFVLLQRLEAKEAELRQITQKYFG